MNSSLHSTQDSMKKLIGWNLGLPKVSESFANDFNGTRTSPLVFQKGTVDLNGYESRENLHFKDVMLNKQAALHQSLCVHYALKKIQPQFGHAKLHNWNTYLSGTVTCLQCLAHSVITIHEKIFTLTSSLASILFQAACNFPQILYSRAEHVF